MNVAILTISSLSLVTSTATLVILVTAAKKLDDKGKQVKSEVESFKAKTNRNLDRIKTVLREMEL